MTSRPQNNKDSGPRGARRNSINLVADALAELYQSLDKPDLGRGASKKRNFARWPYRHDSLPLRVRHPGGNDVQLRVACRNISRGGLSVLHNSFMHSGTLCTVILDHPKKGPVEVHGKVVRCTHRTGLIHEIGICFDEPIRAKEYLSQDPLGNIFSLERVDPSLMRGLVVHIEPKSAERQIVRHLLRETGLRIAGVPTLMEAAGEVDGCELVIVSTELADTSPAQTVAALRDMGVEAPILMVTPDASPTSRAKIAGVPAQSFLARPLQQAYLVRAVAEWMIVERGAWRSAGHDTPAGEDAVSDDETLKVFGHDMIAAFGGDDFAGVRRACIRAADAARKKNWRTVAQLAADTVAILDREKSLARSRAPLESLLAVCAPGESLSSRGQGRQRAA